MANTQTGDLAQQLQKRLEEYSDYDTGRVITLGSYNGQPLEWVAVKYENHKVLLVCRNDLLSEPFDSRNINAWKESSLRRFLNTDFFAKAFSNEEKKLVLNSKLIDVGSKDDVFLLSWDEAWQCMVKGLADGDYTWLRTKYSDKDGVYGLNNDGNRNKLSPTDRHRVRPAVWVKRLATAPPAPKFAKPYADCSVGGHFFLGRYPHGTNGEEKPIEWRVLAREEGRILAITEYALLAKPYNVEKVDITWSQCTLRRWLNNWFPARAFKPEEAACLMQTTISNPNSPSGWNNIPGGPNTEDRVFLLSYGEAEKYFSGNGDRCCKPVAKLKKDWNWSGDDVDTRNCWWWLRSPGGHAYYAAGVRTDGSFNSGDVNYGDGALRPALF